MARPPRAPKPTPEPPAIVTFRRVMGDVCDWYATGWGETANPESAFPALAAEHPMVPARELGRLLDTAGHVFEAIIAAHFPPRHRRAE